MNIAQVLSERSAEAGDALAIEARGRKLSFHQLERASAGFANRLRSAGVEPGERALLVCGISVELYAALIGCFRAGVVAVFPDPSAGLRQLNSCVELTSPRVFVGSAKAQLLRLASGAVRSIPLRMMARILKARGRDAGLVVDAGASDTAMITFTSGSTGAPKAAQRTHGFLLAQHAVLERTLGLTPGQIDLTALPVFVLANLASGVTSVVPDADLRRPGEIDPMPVVDQIRRSGVMSAVASPAFFERILQARTQLPMLRKIFTGGAPVFPSLLDRLARMSPEADVTAVYGSTEAEPIAEIERREIQATDIGRMQSGGGLLAGRPVGEIRCRIMRNRWGTPIRERSRGEFESESVEAGEAGEIVVSGEHVLRGYLGGRGDEETKFRVDGEVWHRTGDLGRFDEAGRIWLLGRAAARIEDGAGILYPFTVETAAAMFAGVRRCAVLRNKGRRVLALDADRMPDGLRDAIGWAGIEEFKLCRIPVDRRHNAKVDYPALMKMLAR
ncbi:MAG: AMP-binding protein [Acidobacteriaceae bacterium]|nr:AMP-binding protein [Acidobacteriaceae bacterium]